MNIDGQSGSIAFGGLVTDATRTLRTVTAGFRYSGSARRVEPDDLWHIGSNTKAMTATLYARLVEKGQASWGATLEEVFPDLVLHESWRGITLEELMSHTGGLTDRGVLSVWNLIRSELDERPLPVQRLDVAKRAFSVPRRSERGNYVYANANYVVVGAAIEERTAGSWESAIRSELFEPLGMQSVGFGAPSGDQPLGHKRSLLPWRGLRPVKPGPAADNPPFMRPAGGIHTTLEDYSKFLRLFLANGASLLSLESIERLATPASKEPAYALGWLVEDLPSAGGRALVHDGSNTMWYATAIVGLESGLAVVAACNEGSTRGADAVHSLARELLQQAR